MTSTWRKHLIICLFLGLLAVPIYFLDLASTLQGGGNWITFDFRGLIFWTYFTLLAIHVTLSSIAVCAERWFKPAPPPALMRYPQDFARSSLVCVLAPSPSPVL